VPRRFQVARLVEQKEDEIVRYAIDEVKRRYPNFQALHDRAYEKGYRDFQLVVRYNVQGMLMEDLDVASEKLLYWFRTIVNALGMTPAFMRDSFTALREGFRLKLPAEAFTLMEPYLTRTIEVISDIPEPHKPAV
jgi:hypothetical protein